MLSFLQETFRLKMQKNKLVHLSITPWGLVDFNSKKTTNTAARVTRSVLQDRKFHLPIPHYAAIYVGHCDYPVGNETVSAWRAHRHVLAVTSHLTG